MGDVINLRQARKARDRKAAEQAAAEARALHGRTKGQRKLEQAESEKLSRMVDQAKLEPPSNNHSSCRTCSGIHPSLRESRAA